MRGIRLSAVLAAVALVGLALFATFPAVAGEEVTDANLDQMIASAKTPQDHEAIAAYYDKEAARLTEYAKLHHSTHETYEKFRMKPPDMANHCNELAKSYQRSADQAKALAEAHRAMGKTAEGSSGQ